MPVVDRLRVPEPGHLGSKDRQAPSLQGEESGNSPNLPKPEWRYTTGTPDGAEIPDPGSGRFAERYSRAEYPSTEKVPIVTPPSPIPSRRARQGTRP